MNADINRKRGKPKPLTRRVSVQHTYEVPADQLWSCCVSYRCLSAMMASLVTYQGLPDGEMQAGQSVDLQVTHFKFTPPVNWHIDVLQRDDQNRVLQTSEYGGSFNTYLHTLTVDAQGERQSRLTDHIEFDAGWLSLPMMWWVNHIYTKRDAPRRLLLGLS
jgi:hypothetical protein